MIIENCKHLPIKQISKKEQEPFIQKVDKIISAKQTGKNSSELEAEIDEMVYKLYGLTKEEIAIIKDSSK